MGSTLIPPSFETQHDPGLSQRELALKIANRRRQAKKILVHRMGQLPKPASIQMACDILDDPPEVLGGMRVHQLLMAVRGLGVQSARKLCVFAEVPEMVRLRDLRPGERAALVSVLRMRAGAGRERGERLARGEARRVVV